MTTWYGKPPTHRVHPTHGTKEELLTLYNQGRLAPAMVRLLFQNLINTGEAWTIGGRVQTMAAHLIASGVCHTPTKGY